jgi:hypothetical protein
VNQNVLIGRQVDAFMAASLQEEGLRALFTHLATKIKIEAEVGLLVHYTGIDIIQDREYVKIHVSSYIGNILANHGLEQGSKTGSRLIEPLHPSALRELEETYPPTDAIEISK